MKRSFTVVIIAVFSLALAHNAYAAKCQAEKEAKKDAQQVMKEKSKDVKVVQRQLTKTTNNKNSKVSKCNTKCGNYEAQARALGSKIQSCSLATSIFNVIWVDPNFTEASCMSTAVFGNIFEDVLDGILCGIFAWCDSEASRRAEQRRRAVCRKKVNSLCPKLISKRVQKQEYRQTCDTDIAILQTEINRLTSTALPAAQTAYSAAKADYDAKAAAYTACMSAP
jgi:hypothetical protein